MPTISNTHLSSPAPVTPVERIQALDVLRGFALFGILLVNMHDFLAAPIGAAGGIVKWGVDFFAEGSFYPLFSFLFGVGFAIQMARLEQKGAGAMVLYVRRLTVLLLIAFGFYVLLEDRNILIRYAVLGFPLLLFRRASRRTLLIAVLLSVVLATAYRPLERAIAEARRADPVIAAVMDREAAARAELRKEQRMLWIEAAESGTYGDFVRLRGRELIEEFPAIPYPTLPHIFALFLLGVYAVRRGIVERLEEHRPLLRKVMGWGLALGLLAGMVPVFGPRISPPGESFAFDFAMGVLRRIGEPGLSLCYASGLVLLMRREISQRGLAVLAPVGRMALTNYMLQSIAMTAIFYGYGLGWNGQVGPIGGVILTLAIFLFQIPLSTWWLEQFRFGPAEWLWRSLTYGRMQPMRLPAAPPVPIPAKPMIEQ